MLEVTVCQVHLKLATVYVNGNIVAMHRNLSRFFSLELRSSCPHCHIFVFMTHDISLYLPHSSLPTSTYS
jgi:hypothetical protein